MITMEKEEIFRNTTDYYLKQHIGVHSDLLNFATKYGGNKILDIGCATGAYSKKLNELGYSSIGIDINPDYIRIAQDQGIEAYQMSAEHLDFPDNYFDSVLLFEVLEHVNDPYVIIKEASRVAKKNILITVPDSTNFKKLKQCGLTYDHMLDLDHKKFFSKNDLKTLFAELSKEKELKRFEVYSKGPLHVGTIFLPWWLKYPIHILYKVKIIKDVLFYRLFGLIEL